MVNKTFLKKFIFDEFVFGKLEFEAESVVEVLFGDVDTVFQ